MVYNSCKVSKLLNYYTPAKMLAQQWKTFNN